MARNTAPSRQHYDEHYPEVLARAGLTDTDDLAPAFETRIREIFNGYWAERERPTVAAIQDALELYNSGQTMVRAAMQSLDLIHSEIAFGASLAITQTGIERRRLKAILSFVLWLITSPERSWSRFTKSNSSRTPTSMRLFRSEIAELHS
jgi:hypothetical protein